MRILTMILIAIMLSACGGSPEIGPTGPQGEPGADGVDGQNGQDGADGEDGQDGAPGANGLGCSVQQNTLGALITCGDGSSALILHGRNGDNGKTCKTEKRCLKGKHFKVCKTVRVCEID